MRDARYRALRMRGTRQTYYYVLRVKICVYIYIHICIYIYIYIYTHTILVLREAMLLFCRATLTTVKLRPYVESRRCLRATST